MMWKRHVWMVVGVLFLAAACSGDGGGTITPPDPDGGTLRGTVTGPGGPIPEAEIAVSGGGTMRTNGDGEFSFSNVPAGQKTVTITPPSGFELASGETAAKSANVPEGGTATLTWSLRLADTDPRDVEVGLTATTFTPRDVTIPVGSTIVWVNQTAVAHTISPNQPNEAGTWVDTNISGLNTEFEHTFSTAGTFDYVCKLHAGMTGVVRVH